MNYLNHENLLYVVVMGKNGNFAILSKIDLENISMILFIMSFNFNEMHW